MPDVEQDLEGEEEEYYDEEDEEDEISDYNERDLSNAVQVRRSVECWYSYGVCGHGGPFEHLRFLRTRTRRRKQYKTPPTFCRDFFLTSCAIN